MSRKIVVSFPGSRGYEIPLLYFGAKHYEDIGYEKVFINNVILDELSHEELVAALVENAKEAIKSINFNENDEVVFIAKSIGTVVACKIKEMLKFPIKLILFTPIEEALNYIKRDNDILLVSLGTKDRYVDYEVVKKLCERENVNCYIEENIGHRMEVMNDLQRNLNVIANVIGHIE